LAAKIKQELGVEVKLIEGAGGIYDIKVDQTLVYSRHANNNQFPETDESVVEAIRAV